MVVMVFIRFSVTGAGHAAGSLPDLLFYAKCDGMAVTGRVLGGR